MKVLVIFTVLVTINNFIRANVLLKNVRQIRATDVTEQLLEMFRIMIKNGYPELGIPVLDPYKLEYAHVETPFDFFRITANISEGIFRGLGDFQFNKIDVSEEELSLDFDVDFPSLIFTAEYYEMEGSIKEVFPLAGHGVLQVEVYELNMRSKIYMKQSEDKSTFIDRFEDPGFSVARIVSKTEYDDNFDDILNAMIEDLLAGYLNRFNKFLAITFTDIIKDALNSYLEKITH